MGLAIRDEHGTYQIEVICGIAAKHKVDVISLQVLWMIKSNPDKFDFELPEQGKRMLAALQECMNSKRLKESVLKQKAFFDSFPYEQHIANCFPERVK